MPESIPTTLDALDRLADAAERYLDLFLAEAVPHDPARLAAAWSVIFARETLGGVLIPLLVTWLHPAGWVCIELAGGPGPDATVLAVPPAGTVPYDRLAHHHTTRTPLYLCADFFRLPPDAQRERVLAAAVEQQLLDAVLPSEPTR
jgi:hypothetical protein